MIKNFSKELSGKIPIIGVGGVIRENLLMKKLLQEHHYYSFTLVLFIEVPLQQKI